MHDSFRLLAFNPYDDITSSEDSDKNEKEFVIQMFGINENRGNRINIRNRLYTLLLCKDWKQLEQ